MAKSLELIQESGEVIVRIRAEQWTLQPPLLGHQRKLEAKAQELIKDSTVEAERAAVVAPADELPDEVVTALASPEDEPLSATVVGVLPWWRLLFDLCADRPLPEDDDCPLWMASTLVVAQLQVHWMLHPFLGLGLPAIPAPGTTTPASLPNQPSR